MKTKFKYHQNQKVECWGICYSADGKKIYCTGQSGNINVWDITTYTKTQVLQTNGKFTMPVSTVIKNFHAMKAVTSLSKIEQQRAPMAN